MTKSTGKTMIKYLQLPVSFDANRMLDELSVIEHSYWKTHYQKTQYAGDWTVLALRSIMGDPSLIHAVPASNMHQYKDTPLLEQCLYIKDVLNYLQCEKTAVRLMKLNAGSVIKKHKDAQMNFENGEARIHIPVKTNDQVEFYIEDERINMKEGECWYLNLNLEHNVNNFGSEDRIHLVVDCMVNDWMKETFAGNVYKKKEIAKQQYSAGERVKIIEALRRMNTVTSIKMADEMENTND